MALPEKTLAEPLCTWLSGWLAKQRLSTEFRVVPLAGDGSPRPFYRIEIPHKSFVLLSEPTWTLSKDYPPHQAYLASQGVPVPEFLAFDAELGVLLMQDLGDELLQHRLLTSPQDKMPWLEEATRLLARLHGSTFPVPHDLPIASRRFDQKKYGDELRFTLEHLHEGLFGLGKLSLAEIDSIEAFCAHLSGFGPDVFCHRDYHTRNLLVFEESLWVIDFQDARLGPVEYDLASLLFDAYIPLSLSERQHLLGLYKKVLSAFPLHQKIDWKGLEDRLHQVAFQRVVKAAGSFASFFTKQGKSSHLKYILPALESAHWLASRMPQGAPRLPLALWIEKAKEGTK
jgi:N-acetylmuramate 1-kinase